MIAKTFIKYSLKILLANKKFMINTIYIPYLSKKYPINITKSIDPDYKDIETAIHVECKEAWLNQERDMSDLWALLELIPELIEERRKDKKQGIINIRMTSEEKTKIEYLAKQNGYSNVSSYIRDKALVLN